jgi:anti-sigma-K factor RskA
MTPEDLDRFAAEYALGLLDGEDAARAERMLVADRGFEAAVERWRTHFAELDETAAPMTVPDALWRRIEAEIAAEPKTAPLPVTPVIVPDPRNAFRSLWHNLAFWRFAGLATTAASLLLAGALYLTAEFMSEFLATERARKPTLIAILVKEGTNEPGAIVNTFANGRAELIPLESINVPPDRALQIWTLWDRARGPVSVGLIDQARSVRLNLENLPPPGPNQLFEITLEPATGSPTGRPTGPILMKGTTATTL